MGTNFTTNKLVNSTNISSILGTHVIKMTVTEKSKFSKRR